MRGGAPFPVRLRYCKLGKIRWISHRDVARALERAFRISALPLAFTEGFSPRPRVSFGLALSTGHESDAEYLDVVFAQPVDLAALPNVLTDALPDGLAVTGAAPLVERAPALQEAVTAVEWRVEVDVAGAAAFRRDLEAALASPSLLTNRRRKGREVVEDVRPVIRRVDVVDGKPCTLVMELATQPRSAKPGEVLAAISRDAVEVRARRTRQWIERDGARWEPLDADTRVTREGIDARAGAPRGVGARAGTAGTGGRERRRDRDGHADGEQRRRSTEEATPAGLAGRAPA